jgi:virginiamycin B lyase
MNSAILHALRPLPALSDIAWTSYVRKTKRGGQMTMLIRLVFLFLLIREGSAHAAFDWTEFPLPKGSGPHDVAPAPDGRVWFTAQAAGALGLLDPRTGHVDEFPLGRGSAPHGVIVGPDDAPWVTDGGLNAILRFDPAAHRIRSFPLPADRAEVNLNTATFDQTGMLWFTGQSGVYGRVDPASGDVRVWDAPRGPGAYGITTTPAGAVYFASLAGSYIARIDPATGAAIVIEPPTPQQEARRIWSDSRGALWISEFLAGQIARFDPNGNTWQTWRLPGNRPQPYGMYVDQHDAVWVSDFSAGTLLRFDSAKGQFSGAAGQQTDVWIRQLLGRPGEVWGADSAHDRLIRALVHE